MNVAPQPILDQEDESQTAGIVAGPGRHLLFTNGYARHGGGEVALIDHVRRRVRAGDVVRVELLEEGPVVELLRAEGLDVEVRPFAWCGGRVASLMMMARRITAMARRLRRHRIDAVFAYTFTDGVIAALAGRLARVPVIWRAQGEMYTADGRIRGHWLSRHLPAFVRLTRPRIACTTHDEAERAIAAGVPRSLVEVIPLGIDIERIEAAVPAPLEGDRPEMPRRRIGAGQRPRIGIFARLVRWKGQDVFLRALSLLREQGLDFEAIVVGGADFGDGAAYVDELAALVERGGLSDRVTLLGHRDDVAGLMKRCAIVAHCSHQEPFGLVVIEAMAAGCAVLASDVSGPRESVDPGVTGMLVAPGDAHRLADALARLITDQTLRERLARAGRREVARRFGLSASLERLDALLPAGGRD